MDRIEDMRVPSGGNDVWGCVAKKAELDDILRRVEAAGAAAGAALRERRRRATHGRA